MEQGFGEPTPDGQKWQERKFSRKGPDNAVTEDTNYYVSVCGLAGPIPTSLSPIQPSIAQHRHHLPSNLCQKRPSDYPLFDKASALFCRHSSASRLLRDNATSLDSLRRSQTSRNTLPARLSHRSFVRLSADRPTRGGLRSSIHHTCVRRPRTSDTPNHEPLRICRDGHCRP